MARAATPNYWPRWAWLVPPYVVALPFVHDGWWWVADLSADECSPFPVATAKLRFWARERDVDFERRITVPSTPYFLNPWQRLYEVYASTDDDSWIPDWFDMGPIRRLRELNARHRQQLEEGDLELRRLSAWH